MRIKFSLDLRLAAPVCQTAKTKHSICVVNGTISIVCFPSRLQGVWAYHYWQVEENLQKHLRSIVTLLKEIVQEELEVYTRHFRFLKDSHVTVWDPEHGEIQAEIRLPVAMETLDSMPDMTPLVEQYNDAVDNLVPDMDTVQYFYDNVSFTEEKFIVPFLRGVS